jgi:short subunit dehydrogenase
MQRGTTRNLCTGIGLMRSSAPAGSAVKDSRRTTLTGAVKALRRATCRGHGRPSTGAWPADAAPRAPHLNHHAVARLPVSCGHCAEHEDPCRVQLGNRTTLRGVSLPGSLLRDSHGSTRLRRRRSNHVNTGVGAQPEGRSARMSTAWLSGRVAIVTGASRGIGRAVQRLAAEGVAVAVAARTEHAKDERLPGTIHDVADGIRRDGGQAVAVICDVADDEALFRLVATTQDSFGPPDILVNNAAFTVLDQRPKSGSQSGSGSDAGRTDPRSALSILIPRGPRFLYVTRDPVPCR